MIKVFFDTSVIFSALYSKKGASYRLVTLSKNKKIMAISTLTVIQELKDNLNKLNLETSAIDKFVFENDFLVREEITEQETQPYINIVHEKDAHVVAGAFLTGCQYLLTLDKKHLDNPEVRKKIKNLTILSPKKLLEMIKKTY
jgi:putative PIN family toxin of toxin-antitoxin system